jgi:peptidoglycan/xylan/chitin deacetylase (PgdA/CDA1 family)
VKAYLVKTPKLVQRMYPKRVWAFPNKKKTVYLTFDDGPIPEVTPWVLDTLKKFNFKATFFCIGKNIKKHSEIANRIISEGHSIGNHTHNHLNGWKTETNTYETNVDICEAEIVNLGDVSANKLFRPPYGRITTTQTKTLQKKGYNIIMWDVLSADFDSSISKEKCFQNVLKNMKEGSIVVFHDSIKAEEKLRYTLPKLLQFISDNGWEAKAL